jgi:hypothetical protein
MPPLSDEDRHGGAIDTDIQDVDRRIRLPTYVSFLDFFPSAEHMAKIYTSFPVSLWLNIGHVYGLFLDSGIYCSLCEQCGRYRGATAPVKSRVCFVSAYGFD